MKKLFALAVLAMLTLAAMAQQAVGTLSVLPRIGVSVTNLPGDDIMIAAGQYPVTPRNKAGVIAGVDFDYQLMPNISLMLGAHYVQQGCRYDNSVEKKDQSGHVVGGSGFSDWSTQLHYLQVPLIVNGYIAQGFALKTGVQLGFPLSGKMKYTDVEYVKNDEGIVTSEKHTQETVDLKNTLTKVNVSIPVGLSYEFANVVLDARYNICLTRYQNIKGFDSPKNKVFTFSAAYRFAL